MPNPIASRACGGITNSLSEDDFMTAAAGPKNPMADWEKLRDEWLSRLSTLVESVQSWAQEIGWSTRRIEKQLEESQIGSYRAPALLLQEGTTRLLLEPIARFVPGADGIVDLYSMPANDDIASLYFDDGDWQLHYMSPGTSAGPTIQEANSKKFSKETLKEVLEEMRKNAA
jgi:hypothetical protein